MSTRATPATYLVEGSEDLVTGKVEAISILSAARMGLPSDSQRFGFWLARRPRWQAENLAGSRPQAVQLKRLNFIHTARWVDVARFPKFPPESGLRGSNEPFEPFRWNLFVSNLNQGWEPYFQAFLDSFGSGINTIWGDSLDYPGYPRPMTRAALNEWATHRLPLSPVYYAAYPHLTTNDVRVVLRVRRELESARADSEAAHAAPECVVGPSQGDTQRLVERLQHCFIDLAEKPRGWPDMTLGPAEANGMTGFVSLMPIRPGAEPDASKLLDELEGPTNASQFRKIEGTHFARLAVLDRDRAAHHPGRPLRLQRSWLLFSADFDATIDELELRARKRPGSRSRRLGRKRRAALARRLELERYFRRVVANEQIGSLFELCYSGEAPEPEKIVTDLVHSVLPRQVFFRDYPDATLREIVQAANVASEISTQESLQEAVSAHLDGGRA